MDKVVCFPRTENTFEAYFGKSLEVRLEMFAMLLGALCKKS